VSTLLSHLGRGWAFPVCPRGREGALVYAAGPDKVRQSIFLILDCEPGERLMRPDFGCPLRSHLMEPNTTALRTLIRQQVEQALATWEPRIEVSVVDVDTGAEPELVLIGVAYRHLVDDRPDNLVYPFHLGQP
jgi:phage baseplate assembly protein W